MAKVLEQPLAHHCTHRSCLPDCSDLIVLTRRELNHSHYLTLHLHYRQQLGPIAVPVKGQSIVIGGHELTHAGEDEGTGEFLQLDSL